MAFSSEDQHDRYLLHTTQTRCRPIKSRILNGGRYLLHTTQTKFKPMQSRTRTKWMVDG